MKKLVTKLTLIAFFAGIIGVGLYVTGSNSEITAGPTDGVTGMWRTVDENGKIKSKVAIWSYKGVLYGRIKQLVPPNPNKRCTKCRKVKNKKTGKLEHPKIEGLLIIWGLKKGSDAWDGGRILDPNNGKTYSCKVWTEGGKLQVRGYLGISLAGRSQTWIR